MTKKITIQLKPNDNKMFQADFFKNNEKVKEEQIDSETFKLYMQEHLDKEKIRQLKKMIKLFDSEEISFNLKN
jgi:acetamidase/formamidase